LLVYFVTNIPFALSFNSHMQRETEQMGRLTVRFGFQNIHMMRSMIAHAQMNYHVSQFGYGNQEIADT